jgi:hypothetical protein
MSQYLAVLLPLLAAVVAWYVNERSKRAWEEYVRKERNYTALLEALKGFYSASASKDARDAFIQQVNLCWLYCPDQVIQRAYGFLDAVHEQSALSAADRERALGEFVSEIRHDMLTRRIIKRTCLDGSHFRRFASR